MRPNDCAAIVDHGRVIALGPPAELIAALGAEHFVEFTTHNGHPSIDHEQLRSIPGVVHADFVDGRYQLRVQQLHAAIPRLVERLAHLQVHMADLTTRSASLEDVFVQLTGRQFEAEENA
jgi:ABC-2 type transport system ATP-binding protein